MNARPVTDKPETALSVAAGEMNTRKWAGDLSSKQMNTDASTENHWQSDGIVPGFASAGWSIHRYNKTSGKSRGGIVASGLGEYAAKTLVNDANQGSPCFRYRVVSPSGEIFSLVKKTAATNLVDAAASDAAKLTS